jgi:kynureninase
MTDPLLGYRERFPILSESVYMISNSLGAMPREVRESLGEYAAAWEKRGVRAWAEGWWELPTLVGDEVAPLIGAPRGSVTTHSNVTLCSHTILSCFDFSGERNRIVVVDQEFPTVVYAMKAQERRGAEVVVVPSDDPVRVDEGRVCDAIDERTALVPISLVLFRSAYILDARPIIEKAHAVGARVVLDLYQAAGTVPVDLSRLGADFAVGGTLKWLCGGPGVAYLYVRPDLIPTMEPSLTGWQADRSPFDFHVGAVRYRDDAWRFLNGTPGIPSLHACRPGLGILREAGVERIREKSVRQTTLLVEGARERGWKTTAPAEPGRRGGTVALDVPHAFGVSRELLARDVIVDYRPRSGIRVSPHFYSTDEECDRVLREVDEILRTHAWERHSEAPRTVT